MASSDLGDAVVRAADRLQAKQFKTGVTAGIWPQEALFTGSIVAGMVDAYIRTYDDRYLTSGILGGTYILSDSQWNFLGDEAYALMQLSRTDVDPDSNLWRDALETFYAVVKNDPGGTAGYLTGYGGTEPSTAVFYIAHHAVAADYVDAADKVIWRQGLIDWLSEVDDDSADYPVLAMGVATWALANTGDLDDTLIDPSGVGEAYWNLKKLSDLPGLLIGHQIPEGQPYEGGFYWRFDHTNGGTDPFVGGYSEDSIYGAMGLVALAESDPSIAGIDEALSLAREALVNGVAATGAVLEHLTIWGDSYYAYAGEMLQVLTALAQTGDLDLDGFVNFIDFAILANCWRGVGNLYDPQCLASDLDGNGKVDFGDVRVLAKWWLEDIGD